MDSTALVGALLYKDGSVMDRLAYVDGYPGPG
jgi:hypothetical protein